MKTLILAAVVLGLGACSSDNNNSDNNATDMVEMSGYRIELVNLTNNQPLSPPGAILHDGGFRAWEIGKPASDAVEVLAESGGASKLISLQQGNPMFTGKSALLAGQTLSFEIGSSDANMDHLTVATMLINTNDAFTGLTNIDLKGMQTGDKRVFLTPAYDAGTEFNDELTAHIPGPVAGGEGFNAERNDVTSVVTHHPGVVSKDDGHAQSALSQAERFDNPVLMVKITRL